ncbi:uncharacterized protein ASCRUDRAFT_11734 [Ascoidea rubescens DSM 1968]|uniref:Uncharacterized protein n=1 Tax=Ascoidea rubescens DSM 1968 TaxID=1344418 RepID=A0A1D2VS50_9ASCO|nr:hypothetical protein ASCRUDRAFT_11734 [Ascoidea rubescens DSM 1968]ODV64426.1 hypothetical protein ASCRUDRAFT_11734 [Ascoidea rubescens DSM 1968]
MLLLNYLKLLDFDYSKRLADLTLKEKRISKRITKISRNLEPNLLAIFLINLFAIIFIQLILFYNIGNSNKFNNQIISYQEFLESSVDNEIIDYEDNYNDNHNYNHDESYEINYETSIDLTFNKNLEIYENLKSIIFKINEIIKLNDIIFKSINIFLKFIKFYFFLIFLVKFSVIIKELNTNDNDNCETNDDEKFLDPTPDFESSNNSNTNNSLHGKSLILKLFIRFLKTLIIIELLILFNNIFEYYHYNSTGLIYFIDNSNPINPINSNDINNTDDNSLNDSLFQNKFIKLKFTNNFNYDTSLGGIININDISDINRDIISEIICSIDESSADLEFYSLLLNLQLILINFFDTFYFNLKKFTNFTNLFAYSKNTFSKFKLSNLINLSFSITTSSNNNVHYTKISKFELFFNILYKYFDFFDVFIIMFLTISFFLNVLIN